MPSPARTIQIAKEISDPVFTGSGTVPTLTGTTTGTTETEFSQLYNIPANTLKAGSVIEIDASGSYSATVGTTTSIIAMYIGPTTSAVTSRTSLVTTATGIDVADTFAWMFMNWKIVVTAIGTSGVYSSSGGFIRPAIKTANTAISSRMNLVGASSSIDTTVQNTISITNTWSAGNASTAALDQFTVSIRGR